MTGILLLLVMIAVAWLSLWSRDERGQGSWSPFDMRGPPEAPTERTTRAASRERPWKRSGS